MYQNFVAFFLKAGPPVSPMLEIWGGVECTVNRVGDQFFDQLAYNGHAQRMDDLDRFKSIGLKTLRYPFLWEKIAPNGVDNADWSWADVRTARLRELGIRIIAGLVHHGSGPRDTNLLDPEFPEKLARYARAFATRYPWIEDYTPINEPNTTARFSALYGVWYPHARDNASYLRALMNEIRGTVLAMREIRKINPQARLIQTDDFGRCASTPKLEHQRDHENERRWLGWDLLCGRVDAKHPLRHFMEENGIPASELDELVERPCPPDIIGVNHYVLSNRHLDERMERYPAWSHGGNGRDTYADVETVRIEGLTTTPAKDLYREAWQRYRIPVAVTEVHLDAGREDQIRWLMEVWRSAKELRDEGVDFRAVTYWGLLGHYDWHCLVSRCEGYYESGVYDLRGKEPRPTALAGVIHSLATSGDFEHPLLSTPGWWKRDSRIRHPQPARIPEPFEEGSFEITSPACPDPYARPLAITGGRGTLGRAFAFMCERRGIPYRLLTRKELDICDSVGIQSLFQALRPWAVINAAGYVRVDEAESDLERERCEKENVQGPEHLAKACAALGIPFLTFSSDLVFDGSLERPYKESDAVSPLNVYGRTKAESEARVLAANTRSLIVRTSAFFGPWDEHNFVTITLRRLSQGLEMKALSDVQVSPTYVPDLVHTSLNLLIDGETGIWHLANEGAISWSELAARAAAHAGLDAGRIVPVTLAELKLSAPRPHYSVLTSERGVLMPCLDQALGRYFEETALSLRA